MNKHILAGTAVEVSEIGFGCGKLGSMRSSESLQESMRTLLEAYDDGITFYDTADIYGQGRSEELLGKAFVSKRSSVIIASKAGYRLGSVMSLAAKLKPVLRPLLRRLGRGPGPTGRSLGGQKQQEFTPGYLMAAIERSLRRLRTDYLDIFLLHSPDRATLELSDWVEALQRAKAQGKLRFFGVSCRAAQDAPACMRIPGISCVQIPLNLIERAGIESLLATARIKGVGVLARQPLASGILAKPAAALRPEDLPDHRNKFDETRGELKALLKGCNTSEACVQAALRYVLGLEGIASVVLGMSSREHLRQNLAALKQIAGPATTNKIL